ncbi:MAG TPA: nucleotidyltransferase domain-containing protein, partial [archaeon]|nr:nucleotidyltransferase domain-containing protein [archaeon]
MPKRERSFMLKKYEKVLAPFRRLRGDSVIMLYGSVAAGTARPDSDIDIAVIAKDKRVWEQADAIADD